MAIQRRFVDKNERARRARAHRDKARDMEALASEGNADASLWLVSAYLPSPGWDKKGIAPNPQLAVRHLRLAAKKRHPHALFWLGKLHADADTGIVKYDLVKAFELIVQAAEMGSARARRILAWRRMKEGSLQALLADDEKGRDSGWDVSHHDLAEKFIEEYRARRALQQWLLPEEGEALHPVKRKPFSVTRSEWLRGSLTPDFPGVYERQLSTRAGQTIIYSFWSGKLWSEERTHPDELSNDLNAGVLENSRRQRLPWRGLANNPEAAYITYVDPPGMLRPGFGFGGYVVHQEYATSLVKTIHVAKSIPSRDGNYLTACGYRVQNNEGLRLYSSAQKIKVVDGRQPELCPICREIAFVEPTTGTGTRA